MLHMANLYIKVFLTLIIGSPWPLDPLTWASRCGTHSHMFPIPCLLVNQFKLVLMDSQTQSVGSEDQKVVCFI